MDEDSDTESLKDADKAQQVIISGLLRGGQKRVFIAQKARVLHTLLQNEIFKDTIRCQMLTTPRLAEELTNTNCGPFLGSLFELAS